MQIRFESKNVKLIKRLNCYYQDTVRTNLLNTFDYFENSVMGMRPY